MPHHSHNIPPAWQAWSEDQALHVISVYSNPFRWRTRRKLFADFVAHLRQAANVRLHIVEIAFGDRPFEFAEENGSDLRLRTSEPLWHKERAINLAMARLPADWRYAAYVDGDFHFTRHDWALEAIHQLQHSPWVQLFSGYSDLSADHRPFRVQPSFAYAFKNYPQNPARVAAAQQADVKKLYGRPQFPVAAQIPYYGGVNTSSAQAERTMTTRNVARNTTPGATGGAWAFTRAGFDAVGGMLDTCILGAADWYMSFGLVGSTVDGHPEAVSCGKPYEQSIRRWQQRAFAAVKAAIGYVDAHAVHHFHGSKLKRGYGHRWKILQKWDFDPLIDLQADWQGLWKLAGTKPGLRNDLTSYFLSRDEDDSAQDSTCLL